MHAPSVGLLAQIAVLMTLAATSGLGVAGWLAGLTYGAATWALLIRAMQQPDVTGWGPADTVTLARGTLVGAVTALVADSFFRPVPLWVLVALAAVALALDGVDGQVARRTGTCSRLGARFDMETDSALVLVLSVFVAATLGWWALAIGVFRYVFAAAAWVAPWLRAPLPPRFSRKTVAATQGTVLVVAAAGIAPTMVTVLVAVVLAALLWSFGQDVHWLWRHRKPPVEPAHAEQRQMEQRHPELAPFDNAPFERSQVNRSQVALSR
ncbi:CDP-alcohol phosphatidyltransferase family protein [Solwaraspora sp. WMMD791]|uniref:CDP-alcohol phosphatidyltransferase family protein n=1 Tax=Solwaraspora sp. WMMD791 TaxID=3016086 RepID=UPI00249A7EC1|nr:CDP-alcohol phosphatidyltransferase family protein [Solwaraspora sp. WMMD791]WFE28037.1 CDP-alcohol phosphatidyltransferase family protein [Solwaraspora sp. WMMD791]